MPSVFWASLVFDSFIFFFFSFRLAEEHKARGNEAYKAGKYDEACQQYTKAIFHNPNCATYWSNRSAALMMLQKYSSALEDCAQAIKLDESFMKVSIKSSAHT